MTPEEKALELFYKMYNVDCDDDIDGMQYGHAKKCALIAVNELIDSHLVLTTTHDSKPSIRCKTYWQQVKQEIINL
jgi:hypothetical protein